MRRKAVEKWWRGGEWVLMLVLPVVLIGYGYKVTVENKWLREREILESKKEEVVDIPDEKVSQFSWLSVEKSHIVDGKGNRVVLRGVNLCCLGWGQDGWFAAAIEQLDQDWGINVVRTRMYEERMLADSNAEMARLEKDIISHARERGMYVVVHPSLKNHVSLPNRTTARVWQELAQRYKDDPTVIYDLLGEPHDVTDEQTRDGYNKLVEAVRAVNPRALIMVSGVGWGREINTYALEPLEYENIVYRTNPYNPVRDFEGLFGEILGVRPVWLGEFGAGGYPPMTEDEVGALLDKVEPFGVSWTAWNFNSQGCPCLLSDYKTFERSSYGELVYRRIKQTVN